ncbi:MAG: hypothetical protein VKJ04_09350 [Vampirovibrionales bacterium]|nr:hypothetical protein [Vampirovibrionales bacterium]
MNIPMNFSCLRPLAQVLGALFVIMLGMIIISPAFAWEGRWTNASTGLYPLPDTEDPYNDSHTESGIPIKDRIEHFYLPPNPQFEDVDPNELSDNEGRNYSPYALLRLSRDILMYGQMLPKGYYQVKIGTWRDGSPKQKEILRQAGVEEPDVQPGVISQVANIQAEPPPYSEPGSLSTDMTQQDGQAKPVDPDKIARLQKKQAKRPAYTSLIFKKNGKVFLMLPIEERQLVILPWKKSRKLPKTPMAWVEADPNRPDSPVLLHYYYRHLHYIAQLGQA